MKRAVFAAIILVASGLFAQVHIQEKAVITPVLSKRVRAGSGSTHSIRLEIDAIAEETNQIEISGPCIDSTTESHWGTYTLKLDSVAAGLYTFDVTICSYVTKIAEYDSISLFFDDSLVLARGSVPTWGDTYGQGYS